MAQEKVNELKRHLLLGISSILPGAITLLSGLPGELALLAGQCQDSNSLALHMKRISFLKADGQDTAKRSLLRAGLWGMTCYLLEFI